MSKQSRKPEVVLGYEECGHTDVRQRSPFFKEEKSSARAKIGRASQPKLAAHVGGCGPALIRGLLSLDGHPQPQSLERGLTLLRPFHLSNHSFISPAPASLFCSLHICLCQLLPPPLAPSLSVFFLPAFFPFWLPRLSIC